MKTCEVRGCSRVCSWHRPIFSALASANYWGRETRETARLAPRISNHAAIFSRGFPWCHARGTKRKRGYSQSTDSLTSSTNDGSIQQNKHSANINVTIIYGYSPTNKVSPFMSCLFPLVLWQALYLSYKERCFKKVLMFHNKKKQDVSGITPSSVAKGAPCD